VGAGANHEPVAFMGGGRALLLVAHPLVAVGVGQLREAAARFRRRHDHVKGEPEDGVA
jgi:hypothetical protein